MRCRRSISSVEEMVIVTLRELFDKGPRACLEFFKHRQNIVLDLHRTLRFIGRIFQLVEQVVQMICDIFKCEDGR